MPSEAGKNRAADSSNLRARAEAMIRGDAKDLETPSAEEIQQLVHELGVHQIELQMQNEALREAQQGLEASRDRYVDLYDFAPVGYVVLDAKGCIHQINLTAAKLLGQERTRLNGRRLAGFVARGHKQAFYRYLRECASRSPQATCEVLLCPKTGPPVPVKLDTVRAEAEEGTLYRTAISDITERKRAQEALEKARDELEVRVDERTAELREMIDQLRAEIDHRKKAEKALKARERLLDNVFEGMQDGLCILDRDLTIIRANHWHEKKYSTETPLIGKKCYAVYQKRESPCPGCPSRQALEDGQAHDAIVRYPSADNPQGWLQLSSFPLRNDAGEIEGVIEHVKDITERLRQESELRESEARYRLIADNVTDMVWAGEIEGLAELVDADAQATVEVGTDELLGRWQFRFISPSIEQLLGYEVHEGMRLGPRRLLTTVSYTTLKKAFSEEVAMERSGKGDLSRQRTLELEHVTKDGKCRWCEVSLKFLRDDKDRVTGVVGSTRDVSQRKDLEREISAAATHEQQRIGQELHDGLGQQLLGLGLMAQSLHRTLKSKGAPGVESADELVQVAKDAHDHVRTMIKGVRPVDVEGGGLVSALAELADATQKLTGVGCNLECREPVAIENDHAATQLFHVAQEAVRNAVQHARAKQIAIGLGREDHGIRLWVRDDGQGVPAELGRTEGMGLRIMRHRAAMIGGSLAVEPAEGGGTLVSCTIRLEGLR